MDVNGSNFISRLYRVCLAFGEGSGGFYFDLNRLKEQANRLIKDMSLEEALNLLDVYDNITPDKLDLAFNAKLFELREDPQFGFSKILANKQLALVKAYSVLEALAVRNEFKDRSVNQKRYSQ